MSTTATTRPTARLLRRVAFVDRLQGPASRTYGGCDYAFLLRDRTGEIVAVIDGNSRSSRWDSPHSLATDIGRACGREPAARSTFDIETNRAVTDYARRFPVLNEHALVQMTDRYRSTYASGTRAYVRTRPAN